MTTEDMQVKYRAAFTKKMTISKYCLPALKQQLKKLRKNAQFLAHSVVSLYRAKNQYHKVTLMPGVVLTLQPSNPFNSKLLLYHFSFLNKTNAIQDIPLCYKKYCFFSLSKCQFQLFSFIPILSFISIFNQTSIFAKNSVSLKKVKRH